MTHSRCLSPALARVVVAGILAAGCETAGPSVISPPDRQEDKTVLHVDATGVYTFVVHTDVDVTFPDSALYRYPLPGENGSRQPLFELNDAYMALEHDGELLVVGRSGSSGILLTIPRDGSLPVTSPLPPSTYAVRWYEGQLYALTSQGLERLGPDGQSVQRVSQVGSLSGDTYDKRFSRLFAHGGYFYWEERDQTGATQIVRASVNGTDQTPTILSRPPEVPRADEFYEDDFTRLLGIFDGQPLAMTTRVYYETISDSEGAGSVEETMVGAIFTLATDPLDAKVVSQDLAYAVLMGDQLYGIDLGCRAVTLDLQTGTVTPGPASTSDLSELAGFVGFDDALYYSRIDMRFRESLEMLPVREASNP